MTTERTEAEGFTPGPWIVQTKANMPSATADLIKPNGYSAYVSSIHWLALASVIVKTEGSESDEGSANARLIAAAPDLYAACKAMADANDLADVTKARDAARAALAKANGGAA